MPEGSIQSPESPIPAGAGLPPGRSTAERPQQHRGGADLLNAAASGGAISRAEHDDLVDYFLANGEMPGDSKTKPLTVTLGEDRDAKTFRCEVHKILWDEWMDARENGTDKKTGMPDAFVTSSWVVARALVKPQLGPTVTRLQREDPDHAPNDAADLLRRMFRKQSGALLSLSAKVLEYSKLQAEDESVNDAPAAEVEAAKN